MRRFFVLCICYLTACAHTASTTGQFNWQALGNGIYVHSGAHLDIDEGYQGDIANLSVIVGSKGVAVVDTGGSKQVGMQLRAAIAQVTKLPILYVINTHVHPDHTYGNAAFLADKPQFVGHEKLAKAMLSRKEQYDKLNTKLLGAPSETVVPTLLVKDTVKLDLGDRNLIVSAHPIAHTHTDLTVLDDKTSTLFTGDLLFAERTPVLEGDIKGLIAELESLKNAPIKQLVPGHGKPTAQWQAAIDNELRYLNTLLADIRTAIKNHVSLEQTMETAAAGERGKWLLFDVANKRNVNTLYPQLEWE